MKELLTSRKAWLAFYIFLLVASAIYRNVSPAERPLQARQSVIELDELSATGKPSGKKINIAYRDISPNGVDNPPVLVLLHGSPMASRCMDKLVPTLEKYFRLIIPDLPGFGASTLKIESLSMRTHALYLDKLLEHLNITQAHLLGYSQGGGVALNYINSNPKNVQSLIMLSSIGAQEVELTGNYTLNHALHGLQLATIWFFQNAIPHFGALDTLLINENYARNFFESSQKPLRAYLEKYDGPALIIHGKDDFLVPLVAAYEHARITPQSRLFIHEGGHIEIFKDPKDITEQIIQFVHISHAGASTTRADALPERVAKSKEPFGQYRLRFDGTGTVILILLIALATWVSEDLSCIAAGILAANGILSLAAACLACFIGIFIGDTLLFFAGRWLGRPALKKAPFKWLFDEGMIAESTAWLHKRGGLLIIITRFVPGSRLPTYFAAGVMGCRLGTFLIYFAIAAALWTPLLVYTSSIIGGTLLAYFEKYETYALTTLVAAIIFFYISLRIALPMTTWRGRRLLLSKWRRITRWEFWPMWALYTPVLCYIFGYLIFKYRSITIASLANPGIAGAGGLMHERKLAILEAFGTHARDRLARYKALPLSMPLDQRIDILKSFTPQNTESYRVVIKPDRGERGHGVIIAKSFSEAKAALESQTEDMILQEYIPGVEYGIFYYRLPHEEKGRIFSITEKRYTTVEGDGRKTLEELILNDKRAVCQAPKFLSYNADRLEMIPKKGEQLKIIDIGTHSRGCLFLDAAEIETPELLDAVDKMARDIKGYAYGRFDIKASSLDALKKGKDFKAVELNGLSSEATHIYNPGYSYLNAVKTLCKQWGIAYEIGSQNKSKGMKPTSAFELLKLVLK